MNTEGASYVLNKTLCTSRQLVKACNLGRELQWVIKDWEGDGATLRRRVILRRLILQTLQEAIPFTVHILCFWAFSYHRWRTLTWISYSLISMVESGWSWWKVALPWVRIDRFGPDHPLRSFPAEIFLRVYCIIRHYLSICYMHLCKV